MAFMLYSQVRIVLHWCLNLHSFRELGGGYVPIAWTRALFLWGTVRYVLSEMLYLADGETNVLKGAPKQL